MMYSSSFVIESRSPASVSTSASLPNKFFQVGPIPPGSPVSLWHAPQAYCVIISLPSAAVGTISADASSLAASISARASCSAAYSDFNSRSQKKPYIKKKLFSHSIDDAMKWLSGIIGSPLPEWKLLESFIPNSIISNNEKKSAITATFSASLE